MPPMPQAERKELSTSRVLLLRCRALRHGQHANADLFRAELVRRGAEWDDTRCTSGAAVVQWKHPDGRVGGCDTTDGTTWEYRNEALRG
eukprot:gene249-8744_t